MESLVLICVFTLSGQPSCGGGVTQLTSKGCSEPPLMSAERWQSHDESQPVLAVAPPTPHSVFQEHAFGIPELKEQSPAVPVLMIQQPAALHSLAAGSVM